VPTCLLRFVEKAAIDDATNLAFVDCLPRLSDLTLNRPSLDQAALERLSAAKGLKRLELSRAKIDARSMDVLLSFDWLERLRFFSCEFEPAAIDTLETHKSRVKIERE
jgi:hypothetical protein